MHTMTTTSTSAVMPTNGRGGSAVARVITDGTITAVTPTSVTVTTLGANVVAGDVLVLGTQGIWGVCTSVASNTASVKRWYSNLGAAGVMPAVAGSLTAYPAGILRSAAASKFTGFTVNPATITVTITDITGQVVALPLARFNTPGKCWGPWTAVLSAAGTATLTFETTGNLDT